MRNSFLLVALVAMAAANSCGSDTPYAGATEHGIAHFPVAVAADTVPTPAGQLIAALETLPPIDYDTSQWTELIRLDSSIMLDIRYATPNNFVGEQLYDCGRCLLRPRVAQAIAAAHRELSEAGYGLKMYDCYRPRPYQQRLWDKVPDARYVARPSRGSVHNRGAAVDLTLFDRATGRELAMGTDYDFFGPEAHAAYAGLPDSVLAHRQLLQQTLRRHGFATIRTEWWHFDYRGPRYPLSDELWSCPADNVESKE
jgi:D-alanyl-D-alanine dipeptidase